MACIPSSVSVRDVLMSPYPPSPALSIPSRNKNIDHDMEALRLSRQDDPFLKVSFILSFLEKAVPRLNRFVLQVLASRESLADSYVAESDHDAGGAGMPPVMLPFIFDWQAYIRVIFILWKSEFPYCKANFFLIEAN